MNLNGTLVNILMLFFSIVPGLVRSIDLTTPSQPVIDLVCRISSVSDRLWVKNTCASGNFHHTMDGNLEGQLHNITHSDVRQLAETPKR